MSPSTLPLPRRCRPNVGATISSADMRISVVIPAWNAARFLSEAVASVQAQSVAVHEMVIVDDGSTDDTGQVAAGLARDDARIRIVTQPNGGPGSARDRGVAESRADVLALLDADDVWLPAKLERQLAALREPGIRVVFTHGENVFDGVAPRGPVGPMVAYLPSALLAYRHVVVGNGQFDAPGRIADWVPWYLRLKEGGGIAVVEDVLVRRRVHSDNFTTRQIDHRAAYATHVGEALRRRRNQPRPAA